MHLTRSAFFWFLLFVGLVEATAFLASPYRDHPQAASVNRNPTPLRAWPEYLSGNTAPGKDLVVLIGTSQGIGLEFSDDRRIFFSRLKRNMVRERPGVALENWSVAGLRSDQLEMLSLQAVERRASLVVFLVSLGNIDEDWRFRLDIDAADIDLLAGDPALWHMLPGTAVFDQVHYHDVLYRALLKNSHTGRSRIAVLDTVAEYLPVAQHRAAFGAARPRNARLTVAERLETRDGGIRFNSQFPDALNRPAGYYEKQYRRRRLPVFDAVYAGLRERFREAGIDMLWIWTPLAARGFEDTLLAGARPIQRDICRRIEADGWRCLDMTRVLPLDHFITGDMASHLNDKGHEALARKLTPAVVDAVH